MASRTIVYSGLAMLGLVAYLVSGRPPNGAAANAYATSSAAASMVVGSMPAQANAPVPVPSRVERPPLELATRDPFIPVQPAAQASPVATQTLPPAPPPAPVAPPLNLRFAGRMTNPEGLTTVFLMLGETSLPATVGQTLPNGYKVEAITPRHIEFSYPPMNTTARLELPEPPTVEIR